MPQKKKAPDKATRARRISRNVIGAVPPSRVETPKKERKPKHKKKPEAED